MNKPSTSKKSTITAADFAKMYPDKSIKLPLANLPQTQNVNPPPAKKRKKPQQPLPLQSQQLLNPQYNSTLETINIFNKLSKSISITPEIGPKTNFPMAQQSKSKQQQQSPKLPHTTISPIPTMDSNLTQQQLLLSYTNYMKSLTSSTTITPSNKPKKQSNNKTAMNAAAASNFLQLQQQQQLLGLQKSKSQKQNQMYNMPKTQIAGGLTITPSSMIPATKGSNKFNSIPMSVNQAAVNKRYDCITVN